MRKNHGRLRGAVFAFVMLVMALPASAQDAGLRTKLCRPGQVLPYSVMPTYPDEAATAITSGPYDHVRYATSPGLKFGYEPRFNPKVPNLSSYLQNPRVGVGEINFSPTRRPMIRDEHLNIRYLEDNGTWSVIDLKPIIQSWAAANGKAWHGGISSGYNVDRRIAVTNDCHIYTIASALLSAAGQDASRAYRATMLLHSRDGGGTWEIVELRVLGGYPAARLEYQANGGMFSRPPAIITHTLDGGYGRDAVANAHDLHLYVPKLRADGSVDVGPAMLLATNSILGPYNASTTQIVSFGDKITVFYPTTELGTTNYPGLCAAPAGSGCYGTVVYARTFHGSQNRLSDPVRIGVAASAHLKTTVEVDGAVYSVADNHDQPTAAVDSNGVIHVVLGAHGGVLQYATSIGLGQADAGFTAPKPVAFISTNPLTRQYSYATMAIDSQNTLHLTARASYGFRLHYLRKRVGETDFSSPIADRALIDVNGTGETGSIPYIHFNQKMSIDPWGRLWLVVTPYYGEMNPVQRDAYKDAFKLPSMTIQTYVNKEGAIVNWCRKDSPSICIYREAHALVRTSEVYVSYDRGNSWTLATTASFMR